MINDLTNNIRLGLICPLFRLADAMDITSNRVEEIIYNIYTENEMLTEQSVDIWKSHLSISEIKVENFTIFIETRSLLDNEFCLNDLLLELDFVNKFLIKNNYKKLDFEVIFKGEEQKRNELHLKLIAKINYIKREVTNNIQKNNDERNIYGKIELAEKNLEKFETIQDLTEIERILDEIQIYLEDVK